MYEIRWKRVLIALTVLWFVLTRSCSGNQLGWRSHSPLITPINTFQNSSYKINNSTPAALTLNLQPLDQEEVMAGFFDAIFNRRVTPVPEYSSQGINPGVEYPGDKEVITVDPNEPLPRAASRRPIVFENGKN